MSDQNNDGDTVKPTSEEVNEYNNVQTTSNPMNNNDETTNKDLGKKSYPNAVEKFTERENNQQPDFKEADNSIETRIENPVLNERNENNQLIKSIENLTETRNENNKTTISENKTEITAELNINNNAIDQQPSNTQQEKINKNESGSSKTAQPSRKITKEKQKNTDSKTSLQSKSLNSFKQVRNEPEQFKIFGKDTAAADMSSVTSESVVQFEMMYQELDFPGVERQQIMDEIRIIYSQNANSFPHFKEAYMSPDNSVFKDFVDEYIFILRNTFDIPEDPERYDLMMKEVLSGPVLYHEYKQLMSEEVSHARFFWGLSGYAELDANGDGKITANEIEAKYGKSEKKMSKLKRKERTKDDHISLTEFLNCWDHAGNAKKRKNKKKKEGKEQTHRKNKAFKHEKMYSAENFPGVMMHDIAQELRQAYKANKEVLDCFNEEYTHKKNPLFLDFVEELLFVKRNTGHVVPTSQEQFNRLLKKLFQRPVDYTEYCYVLSQITVNKFGWGLDSFAKIDLDSNGSISPEEVEAAVGQSKKKKERFQALEKNNDGKISLAEFLHCWEHETSTLKMPYKVMMVLTNNADLGTTGRKTGYYLPELAHPYHVFKEAGLDVVFVSPRGGYAPMDPSSYEAYMDDLICANFIEDPQILHMLDNTLNPANIDPKNISVVFYVGGCGPMWDVAFNREIANIARSVYTDHSGIIGAVCHGTCGLLPITLKAATKPTLLENRRVTSFTNEEEEMMFNEETWNIMNFKLETKLVEMGAEFVKGEPFACNVVNHKSIVTGQNPQSATKCAEIIVEELVAKIANKDAFNKLI